MNYTIYFIKSYNVTLDNASDIIKNNIPQTDKHYISKSEMANIRKAFTDQGLRCNVLIKPGEDHLELHFSSYKMSLYSNHILISVPYWESNSSNVVSKEINQIFHTLLDFGYTGYDPQAGKYITSTYEFQKSFTTAKSVEEQSSKTNYMKYEYIGVGLGIVVVIYFLSKMLKKK